MQAKTFNTQSKSTRHISRHLVVCLKWMMHQKQYKIISFEAANTNDQQVISPTLTDGKFDMEKIGRQCHTDF